MRQPIARTLVFNLLLCLALGFSSLSFADNLPEAQRLMKAGQYDQAMEKVDAYLASRPKDAQGRFLKGLIYTETNRPVEAIAILSRLTEDYPELPEPYNNLAVLYAQQKQYDKARLSLEMAIRTHPSYAIAYENLGDVYAKLASQAYDKALQLDNANATTQNKLALIRDLVSVGNRPVIKADDKPVVVAVPSPNLPVVTAPVAKVIPPEPTAVVVASASGAAFEEKMLAPPPSKLSATKAPNQSTATTPAPNSHRAEDEVLKAIAAWADAWSTKNMKAYFAAYSKHFRGNSANRAQWEDERENRIGKRGGKISVSFNKPNIQVDGNKAVASFHQQYKAGALSTGTRKVLIFVRVDNKWLIETEKSN